MEVDAFYREVKYVSICEQQEKSKVSSSIEYHTSPITKDERLFEQICDFVISPFEKFSIDRPYSTSSIASSLFNV
ncbi:unnamed protein product [Rotaria sp. Silwood1]|nr:unnamed protein product [Rotaria sp. Silwood1]